MALPSRRPQFSHSSGHPSPSPADRHSGEASVAGDRPLPLPMATGGVGFAPLLGLGGTDDGIVGFSRSWAQQAEETYQLQSALALRLGSEAAWGCEPCLMLDSADRVVVDGNSEVERLSYRFWITGCLSYHDKIPNGFYLIEGMDPFVWTLCTDVQEASRIPSIESLKSVHPSGSSIQVFIIDGQGDPDLRQLQSIVDCLSCSTASQKDIVEQLAKLVCSHMGGAASNEEEDLLPRWARCSEALKTSSDSVVHPMGKLSVGLCRHRALLFKMLADMINLPCRVAKGCKYCKRVGASSCVVRFGLEREYIVDLVGFPGNLYRPDSLLNGPSSIFISSPLRPPIAQPTEISDNFRFLAEQYLLDCQSFNLTFSDSSTDATVSKDDLMEASSSKYSNEKPTAVSSATFAAKQNELPLHHLQRVARPEDGPAKVLQVVASSNPNADKDVKLIEEHQQGWSRPANDLNLAVEDLKIPWSEISLKEKIGSGSFGTVHRAEWHGSDVAVKILMDQDFYPGRLNEFLREVVIMKSLRHPNIVLFMGAVIEPPNLSIVTEFLSRGNLFRLLHRPGAKEVLDERRRLNMAFDVAKGMNYLHKRNPPIVHRDLKSPNLLVDKKYTVKVCDFGLSRLKAKTFLSSKSLAGTPEWMAPEVLRDEPSNEKSDIYSFGVILWELMTLRQPWNNLNPPQVVAAVGFKGARLDIPSNVNAQVAQIIESCWANEPWRRPSFADIMELLKPLIKPLTQPAVPDTSAL